MIETMNAVVHPFGQIDQMLSHSLSLPFAVMGYVFLLAVIGIGFSVGITECLEAFYQKHTTGKRGENQ